MGSIFVLSGFSGVGKDTIVNEILSRYSKKLDLVYSVSHTTRKPRKGERNGKDYFFVSKEDFLSGEYIEYTKYLGEYYGTPKDFVERANGKNIIMILEPEGAFTIKMACPEAVSIFISASSNELESRLKKRGEKAYKERLKRAEYEAPLMNKYDCVVENVDLERTIKLVYSIIKSCI